MQHNPKNSRVSAAEAPLNRGKTCTYTLTWEKEG